MKKISTLLSMMLLATTSYGQLVINEVQYDPSNSGLNGDANGDGSYDQEGDSFIEFVNTGSSNFDASGYEIWDDTSSTGLLRFVVPSGTFVPPNGAMVVFGSGPLVGSFGGAVMLSADTTSSNLSLNNSGEVIGVKNAMGSWVLFFDSDALSNNPNESYTRNPDLIGSFVQHTDITAVLFSPGTLIDGSPFSTDFVVESISVQSVAGAIINGFGGTLQLSANVLPSFASDLSVSWSVPSGNTVASVNSSGMVTALASGSVWVSATSNDGTSISDSIQISVSASQIISSVSKIGNPRSYQATFALPAANNYRLQIRTVNDTVWKNNKTWGNSSLTQQNFQALEFNATNSIRIGYQNGTQWSYSPSFGFVSDCKPMSIRITELISPFCEGDSAQLKSIITGGFRLKTVLWNTGETTRFIYGQQGQTYTVTVTDESGCSDSASISVSTNNTQYSPTNFVLNKPNAVTFSGIWSPASLGTGVSLVGYRMNYRQAGVGASWTSTPLTSNTTAMVDFTGSGLPSANYEFAVFARVNDNGTVYNTEYACLERKFYNGSGAKWNGNNASELNSFAIYPNPASQSLYLKTNIQGYWRILSVDGKRLLDGTKTAQEELQISLQRLSTGVYLFEWQSENKIERKKLIIQ